MTRQTGTQLRVDDVPPAIMIVQRWYEEFKFKGSSPWHLAATGRIDRAMIRGRSSKGTDFLPSAPIWDEKRTAKRQSGVDFRPTAGGVPLATNGVSALIS